MRVKVRAKAVALCGAVCQAAETLWKRRRWEHQNEVTITLTLSIQATAAADEQPFDIALWPPPSGKSEPRWRMDPAQLEAVLGLWMWTLVSDERLVSNDDFGPKSSRAQDIRCMRIISAGVDDSNWHHKADRQGEMDLWLGSNAVPLLENSLTISALPTPEDMLPALLQAAEAHQKASEWEKAQIILRWACAQYAPPHRTGTKEDNPAGYSPFPRAQDNERQLT